MMMFYLIFGILVWIGQIMAVVVCFRTTSPKWLRVCGAIGGILFIIAMIGAMD